METNDQDEAKKNEYPKYQRPYNNDGSSDQNVDFHFIKFEKNKKKTIPKGPLDG